MNRAFISLYLFLVISIVVIGWGLNQLWESVAPKPEVSTEIKIIFHLIEYDYKKNLTDLLSKVNQQGKNQIQLDVLSLDDMAKSHAMQQLMQGKIVTASTDNQLIWYKRMAETNQVIMLSRKMNQRQESLLYNALLIIFYLSLALVIYLWIWPLSRDAKKLEQQTRSLGKDQLPEELALSNRSTLFPLARAFNHMVKRLRELLASHHDMTNAVSHELRTPLARMKFALAMVSLDQLDEKSRRQLNSVEMDINDMESLINSLLAYAGFEQHTQQLQLTPGRISDLLDHIQQRFIRLPFANKLQLNVQDSSHEMLFICEWKLIETAIQNLLSNATRYAVATIKIQASISDKEYMLTVDDDGPGIPLEAKDRVLESFVRLYDEQGHTTSGFGLGLAIVKRIMQWHQGSVDIECSSALGGARLVLRWPRSTT